uniref:Uncharacterized protein n=1 Tax=Salix viminalis TaxID=40686 RepID=A0A6N2LHB9_SALVM
MHQLSTRAFCADASQISKLVPDISLSAEREGHAHNFSCSGAGSGWVARHTVLKPTPCSPAFAYFSLSR